MQNHIIAIDAKVKGQDIWNIIIRHGHITSFTLLEDVIDLVSVFNKKCSHLFLNGCNGLLGSVCLEKEKSCNSYPGYVV
jgi:hypothetical protein